MVLSKVFEKFAEGIPISVMARALMERALEPKALDALFRERAKRQYEKRLLFSSLVELMALVVCGMHRSVRKAYEAMREQLPVTLSALYGKLDGVEVATSGALVAYSAERLRPVVEELGATRTPWLRGHRIKVLDGNHLAATERRLDVLRDCAAGPLPGQSLVVLEPETGLATQMVGCEDGHAQERSLLEPVLAGVQPKDVYIADRNFCTLGFLFGVAARDGFFVVRQHAKLPIVSQGTLHRRGRTDSGELFEQTVTLRLGEDERVVRRIVLRLDTPTRDGDTEMAILTNLASDVANAKMVADLYRRRWTVESLFARVERNLQSELAALGYGDFTGGFDAAFAMRAGAGFATGAAGIAPCSCAALTHLRSDSVVVPIVSAICIRLIPPDATSTSACCFSASVNLRDCGGGVSAGTCASAFLLTFFLTMTASSPAPPERRSTRPQLTLILCGITGPVCGKRSGIKTAMVVGEQPQPAMAHELTEVCSVQ